MSSELLVTVGITLVDNCEVPESSNYTANIITIS